MKSPVDKMLEEHKELVHSEMKKVTSHVQRFDGEWLLNTLMIEDYQCPFKFRRKHKYKDLTGQRVNVTYYPTTEVVAGFEMEIMKVVRIKVS